MTLEEQKQVEDHISDFLAKLTQAEKAIVYKALHAEGIKLSYCDAIIRKEPAPRYLSANKESSAQTSTKLNLPRGIPPSKFP
jgi:hypothetical protein